MAANLKENNQALKAIRKELQHNFLGLPDIGSAVPRPWLKVRQQLENYPKNRNYITFEEYLSICRENRIEDRITVISAPTCMN